MNVKQLLEMPVNSKVGGFDLLIKTAKGKKQLPGEKHRKEGTGWMHKVVLMDKTGEIWADVVIDKYKPLIAGEILHITVCDVQDSEHMNKPCKKLLVDQFTQPAQIGEPPMDFEHGDSTKTIRSKILCLLTANMFDGTCDLKARIKEVDVAIRIPEMGQVLDRIMEG